MEKVEKKKRELTEKQLAALRRGTEALKARSKEKVKEDTRKGQRKAEEAKRKKKAAKAILDTLLSLPIGSDDVAAGTLSDHAAALASAHNLDAYTGIYLSQIAQALQGSVPSATFLRDTAGDKPTDKAEITSAVTADDIQLARLMADKLGTDI